MERAQEKRLRKQLAAVVDGAKGAIARLAESLDGIEVGRLELVVQGDRRGGRSTGNLDRVLRGELESYCARPAT